VETEIKLRLNNVADVRRLLVRLGFTVSRRRTFEVNLVFDTPSAALRNSRKLLRLRLAGGVQTVTFKGPPIAGPHKSREEVECEVSNAAAMQRIFEGLGLCLAFRYEKYRTEFVGPDRAGVVMLDQTPIGDFLELEGAPRWIDRTARTLGFSSADYITVSYGSLYLEYCVENGVEPSNMVFTSRRK
jgi:adenylate cyclase class 2